MYEGLCLGCCHCRSQHLAGGLKYKEDKYVTNTVDCLQGVFHLKPFASNSLKVTALPARQCV